jgi:hypothetical protein
MGAEDANTATAMSGGKKLKVGVVGAAGGIGQPLALLLKISPLVGELSLFDVAPFTPGVLDAYIFCLCGRLHMYASLGFCTFVRNQPSALSPGLIVVYSSILQHLISKLHASSVVFVPFVWPFPEVAGLGLLDRLPRWTEQLLLSSYISNRTSTISNVSSPSCSI